jgi:DNA-directed RNA polymerase subunit M/transcription elongation factor TFIIS
MTLYQCDRCGKTQEKRMKNIVAITTEGKVRTYHKNSYELCDKCAEHVLWWLEVGKRAQGGDTE